MKTDRNKDIYNSLMSALDNKELLLEKIEYLEGVPPRSLVKICSSVFLQLLTKGNVVSIVCIPRGRKKVGLQKVIGHIIAVDYFSRISTERSIICERAALVRDMVDLKSVLSVTRNKYAYNGVQEVFDRLWSVHRKSIGVDLMHMKNLKGVIDLVG